MAYFRIILKFFSYLRDYVKHEKHGGIHFYLEEYKKQYVFSIECDECDHVIFSESLDRKSW